MDFNVFQKREIIHVFIFLRSSRCAGGRATAPRDYKHYTVYSLYSPSHVCADCLAEGGRGL